MEVYYLPQLLLQLGDGLLGDGLLGDRQCELAAFDERIPGVVLPLLDGGRRHRRRRGRNERVRWGPPFQGQRGGGDDFGNATDSLRSEMQLWPVEEETVGGGGGRTGKSTGCGMQGGVGGGVNKSIYEVIKFFLLLSLCGATRQQYRRDK